MKKIYWTIKTPDKNLLTILNKTKKEAIRLLIIFGLYKNDWKYYYRKGYRCVKVKIVEIK